MERVDVVVVGDHLEGLAAAWGAAEGGVRAVLISRDNLPRTATTLCGVHRGDLERLEVPAPKSARVANQIEVEGSGPCSVAEDAALLVMPFADLEKALLQHLRHAGVEIREQVEVLHTDADSGGWRLQLSAGEPIRAPVIIVADGARSATLGTLGIAQSQRFTATAAEVMTYLCATWPLPKSEAEQRPGLKVIGHGYNKKICNGKFYHVTSIFPLKVDDIALTHGEARQCLRACWALTIDAAQSNADGAAMRAVADGRDIWVHVRDGSGRVLEARRMELARLLRDGEGDHSVVVDLPGRISARGVTLGLESGRGDG